MAQSEAFESAASSALRPALEIDALSKTFDVAGRRVEPAARLAQPIDSPTCHIGFRCAQ